MLFGLPLAVTAFNRVPFFCQALLRRMLGLMASFYYDDCTLQDWEPTAIHAQSVMGQVLEHLGFPFAATCR